MSGQDYEWLWTTEDDERMLIEIKASSWFKGGHELLRDCAFNFTERLSRQEKWTLDGIFLMWLSAVESIVAPDSLLRPIILMAFPDVVWTLGIPKDAIKKAEMTLNVLIQTMVLQKR